jgi:hypothetical protein
MAATHIWPAPYTSTTGYETLVALRAEVVVRIASGAGAVGDGPFRWEGAMKDYKTVVR